MLYSEMIAVCSEIHTKHKYKLCGQNVEFVNVEQAGTYSSHWALEGYIYYAQRSKTHIKRKKRPQRVVALEKQPQREIACCGCF